MRAQNFDPYLEGPYDPVSGQFFIRLKLAYTQSPANPWATNLGAAELERRTARSFEILNAAFNPHGIYFVPKANLDMGCYTILNNVAAGADPSCITVSIASDDGAPNGFAQTTLPCNFCSVGGSENGIPASNTSVLIHEIGHCLGLAHPHDFTVLNKGLMEYSGPATSCNVSSQSCVSTANNNPQYCCGDLIDDTPMFVAPSGNYVYMSSDCAYSTSPTGVVADIYTNYMAYIYPTYCRDRFTPQQVLRMRLFLSMSSVLAAVQVTPEQVGASTTWNTAQTKYAPVEVLSGVTLTISAKLTMTPGTYIIVRRGGTLIVDATISAACDGLWGGIVVEGNGSMPQSNSSGGYSNSQGRVLVQSNGVVEHALCGIGVFGFADADDIDYGGGIAEVYGDLSNCVCGIKFSRYRYQGVPNRSFLYQGTLNLNDGYRGTDNPQKPVFLQLREIDGLRVNYTVFNDARTGDYVGQNLRADGLIADDAGFRAYNCYFNDLDRGIMCSPLDQTGGYGAYEVRRCGFFNCFTGVHSNLPDNFIITDNDFEVGRPPECPETSANTTPRGVALSGYALPVGIVLENNDFYAGNGNAQDKKFRGVTCLSTGGMENFIRRNDFDDLAFGNYALGYNGGLTGLRYECNNNTDNLTADFYVQTGGSVRAIQGDWNSDLFISTAAGNTFTSEGADAWYNDGTNLLYYYSDLPNQNPFGLIGGSTGIEIEEAFQDNSNCGTSGEGCPPPCDPTEVNGWKTSFYQSRSNWLDKRAAYHSATDSAARAQLLLQVTFHRSAMDIAGGKIIRNYALDSTGVKTDSVIVWQERLIAYETDLRLARHHFFQGDFVTYDAWIDSISQRTALDERQTLELADFTAMLAVVRPELEGNTPIHRLSAATLDSLEQYWASDCAEPGIIAREILRRNSRDNDLYCQNLQERTRPQIIPQQNRADAGQMVRIRPNPASDRIFFDYPETMSGLQVDLVTAEGRVVARVAIQNGSGLDLGSLPPGLYLCRISAADGFRQYSKIIVSR